MNIALIGFILIVVSLLLVLFYLLKFNSNKSRKAQNELGKNNDYFSIIDLNTMEFPKNIEHMKFDLLSKATKVIFDSYKALDYVNKLPSSLDKIEWHTWQVSIILRYLKSKNIKVYDLNFKQIDYDTKLDIATKLLQLDSKDLTVEKISTITKLPFYEIEKLYKQKYIR